MKDLIAQKNKDIIEKGGREAYGRPPREEIEKLANLAKRQRLGEAQAPPSPESAASDDVGTVAQVRAVEEPTASSTCQAVRQPWLSLRCFGWGAERTLEHLYSFDLGYSCRVALGVQKSTFARVAIERCDKQSGDRQFLKKVIILQDLSHKNIINVGDSFVTERHEVLVMEFGGHKIRAYLDARHPLTTGEVCSIGRQMLLGIEHFHEKSIIHFDLKDTSILVNGPHVRICNFGLAIILLRADTVNNSDLRQKQALSGEN